MAWTFIFSLVIVGIFLFQGAESGFRLGSYFSDHMVLQRQPSSAVIWGFGRAGSKVHISFSNFSYTTVVGEEMSSNGDGIWISTLHPQPAGGPHTIKIVQNPYTTQIRDVYFGDVWFCSGQSNMQFEMMKVLDANNELKKAQKYNKLRFLKTPMSYDRFPREDVYPPPSQWSGPNYGSLRNFSALCWMYGEQLYDTLKVPIGLVQSTWGGTRIEAWSSPDALYNCGIHKKPPPIFPSNSINDPELEPRGPQNDNSALWNAMVYPYHKMVIHGVIWYQGESNTFFNLQLYNCTFPSLIYDWRLKWYEQSRGHTHLTFPFGYMQLASYTEDLSMAWPWLRWHQTADMGYVPNSVMPATFMAVAMDITDDKSPYGAIHPRDKKTMAMRLGYAGLNIAYQKFYLPFQGPQVKAIVVDKSFLMMLYDQQVKLVGKTGFKYCCRMPSRKCGDNTKTTDWKQPRMSQYNSTTIYLKTTCAPSMVAYSWQQRPCDYKKCAVYANDPYKLPAAPYKWQLLA